MKALQTLLPHRVTGRMVLVIIVSFFGVIIAVNATMATLAVTTFGGVETRNAYHAGLSFSREIAAVRAQDARGWKVDAKVSPWAPDGVTVDVLAKNSAGLSLGGLDVVVTFAHPASRRQDQVVRLQEIGAGVYRGHAELAVGQWDLVVEALADGERVFRSRNRIGVR